MSSVVPEGWEVKRLGELCNSVRGVSYKPDDLYSIKSDSTATLLGSNNIQSGQLIFNNVQFVDRRKVKERQIVRTGDIAICMSNGSKRLVGKNGIFPQTHQSEILTVGAFCSIIRTKEGGNETFISQVLKSDEFFKQVEFSLAGSAINNLKDGDVEDYLFSFPPLPEQKKIASILTSVDEVIKNTQKQIDKLQDLKKANMNELLTKGIGHTEFKDSELGRIPKSWEVSLIGEVCEVGTGKKDTQNKMKYGKYPFFVRSQTIERIDSYSFDGEAILTAGDGVGTGKVFHYVNGRFDFHQRVYKLSDFRGGALGKFLYYCFSSRFLKQVQQFSARGSVESVRMEMITGMAIPLPSLQEQSKIVDCISAIETNISIGKQKLSQTQSLKKSLMQDLLTGKVRVTVN